MHITHGQSIARRFRPVHVHVDVESLRDPLGKDRPHFRHRPENLLNARAQVLDAVQARALNFDAHRGLDSRMMKARALRQGTLHGPEEAEV